MSPAKRAVTEEAMRLAIGDWEAARPRNGIRPQDDEEWEKAIEASVGIVAAMHWALGQTPEDAWDLAYMTNGGAAGRLLLEMAFAGGGAGGSDEAVKKALEALKKATGRAA